MNSSLVTQSVYICAFKSGGELVSYAPLDPANKLPSHLNVSTSQDGVAAICTVQTSEGFKYMDPQIQRCSSLHECNLKMRPFMEPWKFVGEANNVNFITYKSGQTPMKLPISEGLIGCFGIHDVNERTNYVSHYDYYFTGLDSKTYLISHEDVPTDAIMQLTAVFNQTDSQSSDIRTVMCRSSTFVTLPVFQFGFQYSNGSTKFLSLSSTGGHAKEDKVEGNLSRIRRNGGVTEQLFTFHMSADMEAAICMVPMADGTTWLNQTLPLLHAEGQGITEIVAALSFAFILALIFACAIIIILHRRVEKLTKAEVKEILEGTAMTTSNGSSIEKVHVVYADAIGLPEEFRLSPDALTIEWGHVLGEGQFGRCFKGTLIRGGQEQTVAVKMLKDSTNKDLFKDFLGEAKIMAYVGEHENVVKFIGATVKSISKLTCHVVIEHSPCGNLRKFLTANLVSIVNNPSLVTTDIADQPVLLNQLHLASFCAQIAAGMEHVSNMRVIHGDLAARNCLVFPENVVKITDFGLSRRLHNSNYYRKNSKASAQVYLPLGWMAPESLKSLEFCTASDVWSFGITAWEIYTHGQLPFNGFTELGKLAKHLEDGMNNLPQPKYASQEIYDFLLRCWSREKMNRPSFAEAKEFFQRILSETEQRKYSRIAPVVPQSYVGWG